MVFWTHSPDKVTDLSKLVPDGWEVHGREGTLSLVWTGLYAPFPPERSILAAIAIMEAEGVQVAALRIPAIGGSLYGLPIKGMA